MKKILLAFDGSHFSEGAFEFARRLNEKESILMTGVFVPLVNYASLWSFANASAVSGVPVIPLLEEEDTAEVQKNIERFKALCAKNIIEYRVHRDYNDFALPELKKETRYADLLILGSETFYQSTSAEPNTYLKDILQESECPVVIVPEMFEFPENNILAYDGSESSVYAIKQFAYLFPELAENSTLVVYIDDSEKPFPDESYIMELGGRHFPELTLFRLELASVKTFSAWISEKKKALLVSGSYGRSSFSQLFKKSFVSDVIRDHQLPVFIAHHK